jgi:hypothetical protein
MNAPFSSVQVVPDTLDAALLVALIGAPDQYLETNRLQRLPHSRSAAEALLAGKSDCSKRGTDTLTHSALWLRTAACFHVVMHCRSSHYRPAAATGTLSAFFTVIFHKLSHRVLHSIQLARCLVEILAASVALQT